MEQNSAGLIEATVCIDDLPKNFKEEQNNDANTENVINVDGDGETTIVIDINDENASYVFDEESDVKNEKLYYLDDFDDQEFQLQANNMTLSTDDQGMVIFECSELNNDKNTESKKCVLCDIEFSNHEMYMFHVQQSHPILNSGNLYFCPFCDFNAKTRNTIDQHIRIHTNDKPFQCKLCKKSFNQKAGVQQHMRTHSDAKPFSCQLCDSRFKAASTLSAHVMMKHEQLRPYVCEVCNASFGHSSNLLVHMRVHTGERPYKCDICTKTFVQHGHLKAHSRLHSGEKPFKCAYCNTAFTHIGNLRQHEITQHTKDYKHRCYKCNKGFIGPGDLKRHQQKMH